MTSAFWVGEALWVLHAWNMAIWTAVACLFHSSAWTPLLTLKMINMEQNASWEANSRSAGKKSRSFNGTRELIAISTRARHPSPPEPVPSGPHTHMLCLTILISFTHLLLGLRNGIFLTGFPTTIFYKFLISPMRDKCPPALLLYFVILIFGENINYEALYCVIFFTFSNTINVCCFLNMKDQVSYPYKTDFDACINPLKQAVRQNNI
jgi:hypothetical protein